MVDIGPVQLCVVMSLVGAACSASIGNADPEKTTTTQKPHIVEIMESSSSHNMDGSYSFHYRGADGTFREETAVVKDAGTERQHLEITGAYSFFDADGKEVVVHYKAGDRGFVPEGNNIPEEISAAAKANSELPASTDIDERPKEIPITAKASSKLAASPNIVEGSDDSEEDDMFKETPQMPKRIY